MSWQPPTTSAPGPPGPAYVTVSQDAIPEVASVPEKPKPTGRVHHPFLSAGRAGAAPVMAGGVRSMWRNAVFFVVPLPSPTSQDAASDTASWVNCCGLQLPATGLADNCSHCQKSVTGPLCHWVQLCAVAGAGGEHP